MKLHDVRKAVGHGEVLLSIEGRAKPSACGDERTRSIDEMALWDSVPPADIHPSQVEAVSLDATRRSV